MQKTLTQMNIQLANVISDLSGWNVLKRLLVHAGAFNLGLWMRSLFGIGTPRALQGRVLALRAVLDSALDALSSSSTLGRFG
jgi:hypothetical protein